MEMNGTQRIEASREEVYTALNDVDVLRQCIPGCESIEKPSDTEMNANTISGEGSGGMAGFAKGGAKVDLVPDGDATILNYAVSAEIGGKIAQLGSRLIDGTAKKLAGEFFTRFSEIVGPQQVAEEPVSEEASVKKGWVGRLRDSL